MAENIDSEEPSSFRVAVDRFINGRLQDKLELLPENDAKCSDLLAKYERSAWLESAANRSKSIQIATHLVKPTNPRARGTNILWEVGKPTDLNLVGTHSISGDITPDVTGNAAEFDVYALLCLKVAGKTLLQGLIDKDTSAIEALHADSQIAQVLAEKFVKIALPSDSEASSHVLAKQLYWLHGEDPCADDSYHLLAPLFSSPLAHVVYEQIQEDRFGETRKEVRDAYHKGKWLDGVHRVYPALAVQKLGGTKAQTVSRQNLNRRGMNYLLSSLPPTWKSSEFRLPAYAESVFDRLFTGRIEVRRTLWQFQAFLASDPAETMETRNRVDAYVERLIDEATIMTGGFHNSLPQGWSLEEQYNDLAMDEKLWLDPLRAELPGQGDFAREWLGMDWPAAIGRRFAQWLNARLEGRFAVGDAEHRQWKKLLLVDEGEGGWAKQLHRLRRSLDAPTYTPTRNTLDERLAREGEA